MKRTFLLLFLFFTISCKHLTKELLDSKEPEAYVIIENKKIELVADEHGNQYLKQRVDGFDLYIPFPYETQEDPVAPRIYTLNKKIIK